MLGVVICRFVDRELLGDGQTYADERERKDIRWIRIDWRRCIGFISLVSF